MSDALPLPPIEEWDTPHGFRNVASPESVAPVCYCGRSREWPQHNTATAACETCGRPMAEHAMTEDGPSCLQPATAARRVVGDGATCDRCSAYAPFSVQDIVDDDRITRWFACSRHLAAVLRESESDWEVDAVEVRYLTAELAEQSL